MPPLDKALAPSPPMTARQLQSATRRLPRSFYQRDTITVAKELLGKVLLHQIGETLLAGRIVETEAYLGQGDAAAHSAKGPTNRNRVVFGPPGHAYVYFIYGMYECLNLVAEPNGTAGCVLIRAIEPLAGLDAMRLRRPKAKRDRDLASGPGKLTLALGISRALNGADVTRGPLTVREFRQPSPFQIAASPRIGISASAHLPLRFYIADNEYVSRRWPDLPWRGGCVPVSTRTIFHVDMDAFFVSVEELFDPSLKGKPVVVGGRANERGVVSAASYAARKFGVHSALPLREAYRRCPTAIFIPGHPERYREYSGRVHRVLQSFSPRVEMVSIDEAYLDLTGSRKLFGPPLAAAHRLHQEVHKATSLPCSIGIGSSRLVAKICSALAKPNGVLSVCPGAEAEFLAPLDVGKIPGVGKVMEKSLHENGVREIGQLAALDRRFLDEKWGKHGLALAGKARGLDAGGWFEGEVGDNDAAKSISHETTFREDTTDERLIDATLAKLTQLVARRLREQQVFAHTVQLKLRYADFSTITRAHTLDEATQIDTVILENVRALFRKNWQQGRPVRLLGVHAGTLQMREGQLNLIEGERYKKWGKALDAADRLRDKFGESAVGLAAALRHGREERVHENPAGLPGRGPSKSGEQ